MNLVAIADACIKSKSLEDEAVLLAVPRITKSRHVKLAADGPRGVVVGDDGTHTLAVFPVDAVEEWLAKKAGGL
jgi:hypothetical protein